jgi:hypothetical protein
LKIAVVVVMVSSLISLLLGGSLTLIWEMVNTVQILIYMPLLSLKMPWFLYSFYKILNEFSFNFIGFKLTAIFDLKFVELDYNFSMLEFSTDNIFLNAIEVFVTFLAVSLLYLFVASINKVFKNSKFVQKYSK